MAWRTSIWCPNTFDWGGDPVSTNDGKHEWRLHILPNRRNIGSCKAWICCGNRNFSCFFFNLFSLLEDFVWYMQNPRTRTSWEHLPTIFLWNQGNISNLKTNSCRNWRPTTWILEFLESSSKWSFFVCRFQRHFFNINRKLGGGFKDLLFSPLPGEIYNPFWLWLTRFNWAKWWIPPRKWC